MIEFTIKNEETGKNETYKKEKITMGEAEKFYDFVEATEKEQEKSNPNARKVRKLEREFLVNLFTDQGLTEDDILNYMGTKQYFEVMGNIFREINGKDEDEEQDSEDEAGKSEEQSQ
ncbi:phage tail assembly chaperone G [Staphylococcus capitis]|uniref:phage tail assembly chaperone G n=1 Tax=Staphylococcus capitis TaxID=29388 RepID=UPI0036779BD9